MKTPAPVIEVQASVKPVDGSGPFPRLKPFVCAATDSPARRQTKMNVNAQTALAIAGAVCVAMLVKRKAAL